MKPWSWDKQLGLASPLKCAAIQSGQTKNPSKNEVGLDESHHAHTSPKGRGKYFFLDILSHRMSVIAMFRQLSKILVRFWWRPTSRMKSENCGRRRANLLGMEIEFYQVVCHTRRRGIKSSERNTSK